MTELTNEEKKKIYEEEKTRIEVQEKLKKEAAKKKNKNAGIGCLSLIIIVAILAISGVFKSNKNSQTPAPAAKKEIISPQAWAKVEGAVNESLKQGLIKKIDIEAGKAWIEETLWALSNAEVKENMTTVLATYCAVKKNREYRSVEIIGWQSAKKLASYSSWSGFKVY